jgi:hypothetical protein
MGLFKTKSTYDPMSQYTPEQRKSIEALMSLASTGTGGGITLGTAYDGSLGSYDLTDQTRSGLASLQSLLNSAYDPNSDMGQARSVYQNQANNSIFDLESDESGYKAFNKALTKSGKESSDVLNREAAISGNRFSTSMGAQKADLAENLQLQRAQQLANLYQSSQSVAALGAQGLTGLANQVANISGLNITYGDMQRQMEDARAKEQYNEFLRQRNEELSRLDLMNAERSNPLGTISMSSPSAFGKIASGVLTAVGTYFGGPIGGAIGSGIGGALPGETTMTGIPVGVGGTVSSYNNIGSLMTKDNVSQFKSGLSGLGSWFNPSDSTTKTPTQFASLNYTNPVISTGSISSMNPRG